MLQAIGGNEARSDMTTKRLVELDERDSQLEQRMAELGDELAAVQREAVSAAQIQRAVALFRSGLGHALRPRTLPHPAPAPRVGRL